MATGRGARRARGHIRKRGGSFQVLVYAGVDPLTGKPHYLTESTRDETQARRILTRLLAQVDERRNARTRATLSAALEAWLRVHEAEHSTMHAYRGYIRRNILPALGEVPVAKITAQVLEEFYAELRRCRWRCRNGEPAVDHRTGNPHECRTVRHRGGGPTRAGHDCARLECTVIECPPHMCKPLAVSTIRQIHWVLSSALDSAVRWGWIPANPAEVARKPRQRPPQPQPPSAEEATRIVEAAWDQDESWGTLVWLVLVTGMRRGEVVALRWADVDLTAGMLAIRRSYVRVGGRGVVKDTKTHQMRRIALDATTVELLVEHRRRYEDSAAQLDVAPSADAFLFSGRPACDAPYDPSAVTHRYSTMCRALGIDTHLHALRHYSATELLAAGVDLRTVAGRLGHGGGGATTLRVYAAWVGEADRNAAEILAGRVRAPVRRQPSP